MDKGANGSRNLAIFLYSGRELDDRDELQVLVSRHRVPGHGELAARLVPGRHQQAQDSLHVMGFNRMSSKMRI